MSRYLYILIDRRNDSKHLSYHRTQKSAYFEVAKLSKIPYTMKNFNIIGSVGGWKSEHGDFFVLEKNLLDNNFPYESEVVERGEEKLSKKLECSPLEVEKLVFKTKDESSNNYIHVSIEEMDYMVEYAKKYEQLHDLWHKGVEDSLDTILFLRKCKEIIEDFKPDSRKSMT